MSIIILILVILLLQDMGIKNEFKLMKGLLCREAVREVIILGFMTAVIVYGFGFLGLMYK